MVDLPVSSSTAEQWTLNPLVLCSNPRGRTSRRGHRGIGTSWCLTVGLRTRRPESVTVEFCGRYYDDSRRLTCQKVWIVTLRQESELPPSSSLPQNREAREWAALS